MKGIAGLRRPLFLESGGRGVGSGLGQGFL
jgi:hypothetical protein